MDSARLIDDQVRGVAKAALLGSLPCARTAVKAGASAMKETLPGRKSKKSRKEIQAFAEGNPNENPQFPSPNRAFSMTYADPHRVL
jgi:hypothetical protein